MHKVLLHIAGPACLALIFIESGIPHWVKMRIWGRDAYKHRLKPFDCQMCMGWWLGLISGYLETEQAFSIYTCMQVVFIGAMSSVLAVLLYKTISK
ncbi:hypothetical protein FHW36_10663 [Chitinophaga polysaccharea]|uniref:Uncharacterized protein n=1 Tax=Chitinophaga polysaccharea TaxID=1293035 RepID=A0A561PL83_9BACT|nr:hypothetical protein FHW36_10663 [Chitinophaga polysaccharea]